jgi:S-adenosylmethionine synthetase
VAELAKRLADRLYTFALQIKDEDTRNRYIKRVQKLQMRKNRRTMIEDQEKRMIEAYVTDSYDLTPKGIIDGLHLLDVDYNRVSSLGHFGRRDLPWEA